MIEIKIGTKYKTRHKHPKLCTVVDIHKTYNNAGELVKTRYVGQYKGHLNQVMLDCNVVKTTILMGLIND